ncbi:protein serine/threonine phosphatase 2C [Punctularia strigosozonata HHB-11173 SS5]|uniref:protein serine/threonine phosphatase 2C n=1 Tax=Punctularia strigosozonata (strain HHB-11173) TaxID=741275 RepID=UPI0004416BCB|nr:protein serine/threonine phosphatase 2C [Punctularia strigosozonata HHB-11173 SS5]EIN07936.1 protein serine/threonine phosphatase 2C [Punctularia strigosozonata HHB-11173 SS5]
MPGTRCDPEDDIWPCPFELLTERGIQERIEELANPQSQVLDAKRGWKADFLSFQPCFGSANQDRLVVKQLNVGGKQWTLTGVFDGHLGDATVKHSAYHIPIMVEEHLNKALKSTPLSKEVLGPRTVADILCRCFASFDEAIAADVLSLFPGGVKTLPYLSDRVIRDVMNDPKGDVLQKARLCMHGTTALVALVDPDHEHLWVANLGDSQAFLMSPTHTNSSITRRRTSLLTSKHNGANDAEVERVLNEHPEEPAAVADGRVLGVIAPFRSIGDVPFKLPPEFTRRILYNLGPGIPEDATHPWEEFLQHNQTPPYISTEAEVTYRKLDRSRTESYFLVLCSDGLTDLHFPKTDGETVCAIARCLSSPIGDSNLATRLLRDAIGGGDRRKVSAVLTLDTDVSWIDDTTIVVQSL